MITLTLRKPLATLAATFAIVVSVSAPASWAHDGATGIVKERMETMKLMGIAMKDVAAMVKGEKALSEMALANHAATIKAAAAKITRIFPEGSLQEPSAALPAIWDDWERFKAFAIQLEKDADLWASVQAGDMRKVKVGFAKIGKSCKDCHTDFRKKKEK